MNLEGKQQIWKDYQKEIADDKYYYARSCIRQTFFLAPSGLISIYWAINWEKPFWMIPATPLAQESVIIQTWFRLKPL